MRYFVLPFAHNQDVGDETVLSAGPSMMEDTLTASAAADSSNLDNTLTIAPDAQSICSEQSFGFVDGNGLSSTPRDSMRVARKGSRMLPNVPRKSAPAETSTPKATVASVSSAATSSGPLDSPLAAPVLGGPQPATGSVRKVGRFLFLKKNHVIFDLSFAFALRY